MNKSLVDQPFADMTIPYPPNGLYGVTRVGDYVFISGTGPQDQRDGRPLWTGTIGRNLTLQEGYDSARWCAQIHLGVIRDQFGLENVESLVRVFGFATVADDFYDVDRVFDGFSDLMFEVLRERGRHVRTCMGTRNLPNYHISVEIESIWKMKA